MRITQTCGDDSHEDEFASVLDALGDSRVLTVAQLSNDVYEFAENCDGYFAVRLTKAQLRRFIKELEALCARRVTP